MKFVRWSSSLSSSLGIAYNKNKKNTLLKKKKKKKKKVLKFVGQKGRDWNYWSNIQVERFSYDLEKWFWEVFVICFISQWMKGSKHDLFVFPPKKTLIWRGHCPISQSCWSMTSNRSIDWFPESSWAWSFFTQAFA